VCPAPGRSSACRRNLRHLVPWRSRRLGILAVRRIGQCRHRKVGCRALCAGLEYGRSGVGCGAGAALRQLAKADMSLSWPRLKWARSEWRHPGPWARKISATSRPDTNRSNAGCADSRGLSALRKVSVATRV